MFLCLCVVALMLLCNICVLVLRVLEPVVVNDVVMPFGFIDVLNPLHTVVSHFFSLSSGIVNKILSHMCGRLYFPMFLFRVGLLTLMNMASWMVLAILFSSLPRILKLSIDVMWPLMFWWWYIGEGVFKCSLNLSPKVLPDSPTYSSSQPIFKTSMNPNGITTSLPTTGSNTLRTKTQMLHNNISATTHRYKNISANTKGSRCNAQ